MPAEPDQIPTQPQESTRDGIVEAARRRFLRFGAPKTTMDEVAREAGCSRTTLYSHFRNKEDLYARLLEQDAEAFILEASGVLATQADAGQKIRRIVEITRGTYAGNHVMRLALVGDAEMSLEPVAHAFTREQERRIVGLLRQVLDQGVAEGSLREIDTGRVAYLMFHLGQVLVERETAGVGDYPFDEIIALMDTVFADGIAKPRTQRRKKRSEEAAMAFPRWTEEHETFRASVRRFAEEEIRPHSEKWQAEGYFPDELFRKAGELGLLGVRFDPKWGGSGLDYWYTVILVEELVRGRDIGCVVGLLVQCEMATAVMHDHGTDALRKEWLVPAITGERIAALGVTEPGGGSDVASLQTTARVDGDDYVINGSKIFISNGARADFVTLAVRTGGPGPDGVSLVVCPTDAKGFQVSRRLQKVDLHSSDTAELFFDDMRIPRRNLIGEEGRGFRYIMGAFQGERLVLSVMMNALCDDVLGETLAYMAERKAFGKSIASLQVWRHRMADWMTKLEASRALTYLAAEQLAAGDRDGDLTVSMSKLYGADMIRGLILDCAHAFGGYGFMEENYVARCSRGVQNWGIGAGTSDVMREIIAKHRMPVGRA